MIWRHMKWKLMMMEMITAMFIMMTKMLF
uniref:Uncharacterized protein n=1 Tax=Rhizophora mucronata TaxID=61149 RepID=A0A2P2NRA3_RHIMU